MDKSGSLYFKRYAYYKKPLIKEPPSPDLGLVVTVPSYGETGLIGSVKSLGRCIVPECDAEVIILINEPENATAEVSRNNANSYKEALKWVENNSRSKIRFHILYDNTHPARHAGVGLARKIVMDEAAGRFFRAGNQRGIIVGLDADCICDPDYLAEIETQFKSYHLNGASVYYEHPCSGSGNEYQDKGIVDYELHLRYYILAQRYAGFPYAFHALGSSMAVTSEVYQKQGGMNRRKAGEDFYFLHKIIPLGNYKEINTTRVIPAPRVSDRVPFGTGRAMMDWMRKNTDELQTYHPDIFEDLKGLLIRINDFYSAASDDLNKMAGNLPDSILTFIIRETFISKIHHIRQQSTGLITFRDKFFNWFNALKILKYVHFSRDNYYGEVPVRSAYQWLAGKYGLKSDSEITSLDMLEEVRRYDRNHSYHYKKG